MTLADKINLAIAVIAGISAVIALGYTIVTFNILRVTRQQVRELTRPFIEISPHIRTGTQLLTLSIRNTGNRSAHKLRLKLDRDFFAFGRDRQDSNLRSYSAFTREIATFPPRAEMQFHLGIGSTILAEGTGTPTVFTVSAEYSFDQSTFNESTTVDLEPYRNAAVPIEGFAEELARLRSAIDNLVSAIRARP